MIVLPSLESSSWFTKVFYAAAIAPIIFSLLHTMSQQKDIFWYPSPFIRQINQERLGIRDESTDRYSKISLLSGGDLLPHLTKCFASLVVGLDDLGVNYEGIYYLIHTSQSSQEILRTLD